MVTEGFLEVAFMRSFQSVSTVVKVYEAVERCCRTSEEEYICIGEGH